MRERAILSTRNEYVDAVNALITDRFSGKHKVFYSFDSIDDDSRNNYYLGFLNSITPNGLPPHELKVRGCSFRGFQCLFPKTSFFRSNLRGSSFPSG
ncbi:hypothetical protein PAHAL_1G298100 [Panicum hallii]|uniref:Uncharacterized protein n=1 Tax=Panicum hallii TaxID=206008 RepID=A0A2S3GR64_9POAL|nr:hypothetical protein PAHAL_1G298100 [Panicum hallii]